MSFLSWFYNVSFVTSRRVMDVDYADLVYHDVAATTLSRIKEVLYIQTGFLRSFFNYGDVYAKVEGQETNDIDMLGVPKPNQVTALIQRLLGIEGNEP